MNYPGPLAIETTSTHGSERIEEVEMTTDAVDPNERWTAKRRVAQVGSILIGEASVAEAAGKHGLTVTEVEDWREKFLLGAENTLRSRPRDENALKDEQIKKTQSEDRRSRARQ
jgi:transposase-like protein